VAYRDARRIPPAGPAGVVETGDFRGRDPGNAAVFPPPPGGGDFRVGEFRRGSGFLSVGELANVRSPDVHYSSSDTGGSSFDPYANSDGDEMNRWRIDGSAIGRKYDDPAFAPKDAGGNPLIGYPAEDYVHAVGLLVSLGDWVTTRSNVWTVYGTLRGDTQAAVDSGMPALQAISEINRRAIRFEETVDRLPSALKPGTPPRRIGARTVGAYNDTRAQ
jgi:hypothetical protein